MAFAECDQPVQMISGRLFEVWGFRSFANSLRNPEKGERVHRAV